MVRHIHFCVLLGPSFEDADVFDSTPIHQGACNLSEEDLQNLTAASQQLLGEQMKQLATKLYFEVVFFSELRMTGPKCKIPHVEPATMGSQ